MTELIRPNELRGDAHDWTGRFRGQDVWDVLTAARAGNTNRLRQLLNRVPGIVAAEYWYTPPLHFAVREGHATATRLLLDAGADISHRTLYGGETLLQAATERGHDEVASILRAEMERRFAGNGTIHPIHEAVQSGDTDAVRALLDADAALVNRGDALGRRPLHYAVEKAAECEGPEMLDLLLDRGADIDATGFSSDDRLGGQGFRPITLALWQHPYWPQRNDYATARRLLDRGAQYTPTIAAALGDEERLRELLRRDASLADQPEPGGKRPLSAAAERNHAAIVDLLLDAGADPNLPEGPNCPRGYALWAASRFGHRAVAERLLKAGADPNAMVESSGTPTSSAADEDMRALMYCYGGRMDFMGHFWKGNIDALAALLDANPELFDEAVCADGFTMCVSEGHEWIIRLMLSRGLRVPGVVTICQTYLWRNLDLARLLLEHDMDPNLPNWQQVRPLHHMAAKGEVATARLFLEFNADPFARDEEYLATPLAWAARAGQEEFVRFWLDTVEGALGAEPATPQWANAGAWARRREHSAIARLLNAADGPLNA
ncbi:MAG: ankyrin repeat domain-containing protein [Gammaproteobacteria bacterium]|nr:ankyrin repeat domain-containing protein [Gammaproteobacteria bacterium]